VTIAVLYLARCAEGLEPLRKFHDSYLRHPAGIAHDLVVLYKGFTDQESQTEARAVFADTPHIALELQDEGFDIGAYLVAASQIEHDYVCCINTFTEINADGWLAALYHHASQPDVGIAGATASYESMHQSIQLLDRVVWLCREDRIPYDPHLSAHFDFILDQQCPAWKINGLARLARKRSPLSQLKELLIKRPRQFVKRRRRWSKLRQKMQLRWEVSTQDGHPLARLLHFPLFPNPHIRSNGFMLRRADFLAARHSPIRDKLDACEVESGADSLTSQLRRRGLRAILVDRSGAGYDVDSWWRSKTFRLGDQRGLLMSDNRTRDYDQMTPEAKITHAVMSWGDYLMLPPRDFTKLGITFARNPAMTNRTEKPR
jgi:hypothetical protein